VSGQTKATFKAFYISCP